MRTWCPRICGHRADGRWERAWAYERQGLWNCGIELYQEAVRLAPQHAPCYQYMGRAFLEMAKLASASDQPAGAYTMEEVLQLPAEELAALSRHDLFNCAESSLQKARDLDP